MLSLFFDKDDAGSGIPTRAEVRTEDTWDLTPLYATPAEWTADFARLQEEYPVLAEFRGKVGESAAALLALLKCDERISRLIEKVHHYASLRCASIQFQRKRKEGTQARNVAS